MSSLLTPPLTPKTHPSLPAMIPGHSRDHGHQGRRLRGHRRYAPTPSSPLSSPEEDDFEFALPPPLESVPELEMPAPSLPLSLNTQNEIPWRANMTREERDEREAWLAGARGRKGLRIVIVTGKRPSQLLNCRVDAVSVSDGVNRKLPAKSRRSNSYPCAST
jgi:hypothetical protein